MSVIHTFVTAEGGVVSLDLKHIDLVIYDGIGGFVKFECGKTITFDKEHVDDFYALRDKWLESNGYDPETHLKNAIQEEIERNFSDE